MDDIGSGSTGLTQEIDIMDIGSSTPKRKKSKSPLKGVLKIRYDFNAFNAYWTIDNNIIKNHAFEFHQRTIGRRSSN